MPARRKYTYRTKRGVKRYKKNTHYAASVLQAAARRAIMNVAETKKGTNSITDGQEIAHNSYISLADNLVATTQGTQNPDDNTGLNRIGDQVQLQGVSLKFMVELNERYSDVTFRLMIVKCARGDTPTAATLFNGASVNKMLDTINTDRYTIISQKWFKLKAPNSSTIGGANFGGAGSGINSQADQSYQVGLSRATKIIKHWIPGSKFIKSKILQYENQSSMPKFFEYRAVLYAYSNYSTSAVLGYNVARLNDVVKVMYFKDI
jgi:hypothetical protein